MTGIAETSKKCPRCGETKSLAEFGRNRSSSDGTYAYCKPCSAARTRQAQTARRARIGDEEYLKERREAVKRSRQKHPERNQALIRARHRALAELTLRHAKEFQHLYLLAKRGEL